MKISQEKLIQIVREETAKALRVIRRRAVASNGSMEAPGSAQV